MAKVVSPISAKVEVVGKLKEGDYGPYRSVLFLDQSQPEGSEAAKIWKSLSDEETKQTQIDIISASRLTAALQASTENFYPYNSPRRTV